MFIPHSLCRRFCCARTGWTWCAPWSCCHPHSSWPLSPLSSPFFPQISAECQDQIVYLRRCRHRGGRDGNYSELDGCLLLSNIFAFWFLWERHISANDWSKLTIWESSSSWHDGLPDDPPCQYTSINDYKWWFWSPEELFALNTWMSSQSERSRCRWWGRGWRCWW